MRPAGRLQQGDARSAGGAIRLTTRIPFDL